MTLREALVNNESAADAEEADRIVKELREKTQQLAMNGGNLCEVEQLLYDYGLEPDYLDDLLL